MSDPDIRPPAVAGTFYPDRAAELRHMVTEYLGHVEAQPRVVRAAIVPHAGLMYSGQCAAHVFGRISLPDVIVILAPNHTGAGLPRQASLWGRGKFETPIGPVRVAEQFAEEVSRRSALVADDRSAHRREHAIEVELPFIHMMAPEANIVPLVLSWDDWARCKALADSLATIIRDSSTNTLLLASSDMTHYEPAESAALKDRLALDAVESLDGADLLQTCREHNVTMCGRAPAATALEAARQLGGTRAEIVDYRHSGWVTGDDSSVVAYAGVIVP